MKSAQKSGEARTNAAHPDGCIGRETKEPLPRIKETTQTHFRNLS